MSESTNQLNNLTHGKKNLKKICLTSQIFRSSLSQICDVVTSGSDTGAGSKISSTKLLDKTSILKTKCLGLPIKIINQIICLTKACNFTIEICGQFTTAIDYPNFEEASLLSNRFFTKKYRAHRLCFSEKNHCKKCFMFSESQLFIYSVSKRGIFNTRS